MRKYIRIWAFAIMCALFASCNQIAEPQLVPQPQKVTVNKGTFVIDNNVSISGNAEFAVNYLKEKLQKGASVQLKDTQGKKEITIVKNDASGLNKEGYSLSVTPHKIMICCGDDAGAFYGVQTLLQLMPAEIYSEDTPKI